MFRTLTPIFSILIAIAIGYFFTRPIADEIKSLRAETNDYKIAVENAGKYNAKLKELMNEKDSFDDAQIRRLEALVPDDVDEVKLLVDLEEMIRSNGMLLGNITVVPTIDDAAIRPNNSARVTLEEDFVTSDVTFNLIGRYDQFRNLLNDIEKSLVLMEIVNLSFSASEGDLQEYSITIRTYALTPTI